MFAITKSSINDQSFSNDIFKGQFIKCNIGWSDIQPKFPSECIFFTFAQATPSSLLGVNDSGQLVEGQGHIQIEANSIHKGVHDARPDAVCVFHLHSPYTTAIGNFYVFCIDWLRAWSIAVDSSYVCKWIYERSELGY